jgi:hypothetical protein
MLEYDIEMTHTMTMEASHLQALLHTLFSSHSYHGEALLRNSVYIASFIEKRDYMEAFKIIAAFLLASFPVACHALIEPLFRTIHSHKRWKLVCHSQKN